MNYIQRKLASILGLRLNQQMVTAQKIGNGVVTWSGQNKLDQVKSGYMGNDIVYSVVNLITDKAKVPDWYEYQIKDKKAYAKYKSLIAQPDKITDWGEVLRWQSKSMEIVDKPSKISDLLKYPNEQDTWSDLIEVLLAYKLVTGDSYTYAKLIEAGANNGLPNSLHALPSQYMSIIANVQAVPSEVVGYQLQINTVTNFNREEIMHDKFANLDYDGVGSQLYGQSPLHAGSKLLTKSNSQKQYEVSILQNGGHFGVMSMKEQAGATYEELLTQSDLLRAKLRSVKGPENGGSIFITPTDVQFTPISMSAKDMEINQAYWNDVRGFCNMYGVPSQLLNDPDNKSYNSLIEAEKALTVRATIPHLNSLRNNFNRKLYSDWGGVKDRIVDYDLNCYPELQKNKKELMDWISKAPISIERTYELLGEPVPDWMDEETRRTILVPQNLVALGEAPIDLSNDPYGK